MQWVSTYGSDSCGTDSNEDWVLGSYSSVDATDSSSDIVDSESSTRNGGSIWHREHWIFLQDVVGWTCVAAFKIDANTVNTDILRGGNMAICYEQCYNGAQGISQGLINLIARSIIIAASNFATCGILIILVPCKKKPDGFWGLLSTNTAYMILQCPMINWLYNTCVRHP